jgi:hypothetical protein
VSQHIHKWRGRKRRTREHVIAELGVNFVQRQIILNGHTSELVVSDYGIDLVMFTYNSDGEFENGQLGIQVKSTENLAILKTSPAIAFRVEFAHLKAWQEEPLPIILIIYDAAGDGRAFWLYVQSYVNSHSIDPDDDQDTVTVHIPMENRLDAAGIERIRGFRNKVMAQVRGIISHDG